MEWTTGDGIPVLGGRVSISFLPLVVVGDPVEDLLFGGDGRRCHQRAARCIRQQAQAAVAEIASFPAAGAASSSASAADWPCDGHRLRRFAAEMTGCSTLFDVDDVQYGTRIRWKCRSFLRVLNPIQWQLVVVD